MWYNMTEKKETEKQKGRRTGAVNTPARIAELRMLSGMSQQELADRLFVSRSLVSKWETGKRRPEAACVDAMAELFRVPADSILSYRRELLSEISRALPRGLNISPEDLPARIDVFLEGLGTNERRVFVRRYHYLEDLRSIGERYGMSYGAVRTTLSRTGKKLRRFLTEEKGQSK